MATQATAGAGHNRTAHSRRPNISSPNAQFATVVVGEKADRFIVHKTLLTHYSKFFSAALDGSFEEAEEQRVVLAEEDPLVFEFFVHWLYHQRFPDEDSGDHEDLIKKWQSDHSTGDHFVNIYIFSHKYDIKDLRNAAIYGLHYEFQGSPMSGFFGSIIAGKFPSFDIAEKAFECLPSTSPTLRYLIEIFCYCSRISVFKDGENGTYPLFMFNLARRYCELCENSRLAEGIEITLCKFHEHETEDEKSNCVDKVLGKMCTCHLHCEEECRF